MKINKTILFVILVLVLGIFLYYSKNKTVDNPADTATQKTDEIIPKLAPGSIVESRKSNSLGEYLVDTKGMTLYTFTGDEKLNSKCLEKCTENWPPFIYDNKNFATSTDPLSKKMNVLKRPDGSFQYGYIESPLYYYIGDKKAGDMNGNGLNQGKWSIVTLVK